MAIRILFSGKVTALFPNLDFSNPLSRTPNLVPMAPTRPAKKAKGKNRNQNPKKPVEVPTKTPKQLLAEATAALQTGDAGSAATLARDALTAAGEDNKRTAAAYNLLGDIHVELGDIDLARDYFTKAAARDEDGSLPEDLGGGPDKFLWLAQLSEDGGADSVRWFERGATCLRNQIQTLTDAIAEAQRKKVKSVEAALSVQADEKKRKLAETLCAVCEVYMTDLSWEEDAEQRCEALITEATILSPDFPDAWQTVANVRVSQSRVEDARAALERSMELWVDLPPEDPGVPDFPTRVGLARLLMECEMEAEAVEVADRLTTDDDESVESWYLGGFGHYTLGEKSKAESEESWKREWVFARQWLTQCLKLFEAQEYEDERLGEHAKDLLATVNAAVGDLPDIEEEDWEDAGDEDEDEEMEE